MHRWGFRIALSLFLCLGFYPNREAYAQKNAPLPIPRFVSLKAKTVNVHCGPGLHYPVRWQLKRQHMPVEVVAEFDTWRKVRDVQKQEGWIHKSLLSSVRYAVTLEAQGTPSAVAPPLKLLKKPTAESEVVALVGGGVVGKLRLCQEGWCQLVVQNCTGWINKSSLWGVYPKETKFK